MQPTNQPNNRQFNQLIRFVGLALLAALLTAGCNSGGGSKNSYTVSAEAGSGGGISPASRTVDHGATAGFTVTPDEGYAIDQVSGCGGSLSGNTYTTGSITAACTVTAQYTVNSYTVTFANYDGTVLKSETVNHGSGATAPSSPSRTGYTFSGWSPSYDNITGNLTVIAQYTLNSYTVTPQAGGAGGAISPATSQSVNHGTTTNFTIIPNEGYAIDQVSGCEGSLSGNTYTTGSITAACTVTASFALDLAAPADVVATAAYELGQGEITISWSPVANATDYRVYWGQVSGSHPDSTPVSTTSRQLTGLTPDQTYYLVVAATAPGVTGPASEEVSATPTSPTITRGINDTGIDWWANANTNNLTTTQPDFPGQDADFGRDAEARAETLAKIGGGAAGFDFTRLDAAGDPLATQNGEWFDVGDEAAGTRWSCVRDNRTDLIWEVKVIDAGHLRYRDHTYTWYNSDGDTNGGSVGTSNGGSCVGGTNCDTEKFVAAVNAAGLCGAGDWRLPTVQELLSIVHNGRTNPSIDPDYFPNTPLAWFWSSSPSAYDANDAWLVNFGYGSVVNGGEGGYGRVRLVRAGQ